MPIHGASSKPGVGGAAKQVAEHASALARLEIELASLELKRKAGALGAGAGLGLAAGLLALFAVGFGLATVAAALALALDTWLALLARTRIRRGTPPLPEQAIREAKLTTEALRANGDH